MYIQNKIHVPNVNVKDNKPPYADRKLPEAFKGFLHRIMVAIGSIDCGKTTAIIEWILMMQTTHTYDKIWFISPTLHKEAKMANLAPYNVEHVVEYSDKWLIDTKQWIENEIKEYKKYQEYSQTYKKCVLGHKDPDEYELMLLQVHNFQPPINNYIHGHPCYLCVVDDCVGNKKIFSPRMTGPFSNFMVSIRHYSTTLIISSQIFKNGIPSALRSGGIQSWILFNTYTAKLRKIISEELSDNVEHIDDFDKIWKWATEKRHNFLYVDIKNDDPDKKFRHNWDNYIQMPKHPNLSGSDTDVKK